MTKPHWYILGAGSIGCLWAFKLSAAGHPVTLLLRDQTAIELFQTGLGLQLIKDDKKHNVAANYQTIADIETGSIHNLLVTTKSWQCLPALKQVQQKLSTHSTVVLMQNGYGQLQQAKPLLHNHRYFVASTTDGAYKSATHKVVLAGTGVTTLGPYNPKAASLNLSPLPDCNYVEAIEPVLWRKLCINAVINPLTALNDVDNGLITLEPDINAQIAPLCEELASVSAALGFDSFGAGAIEAQVREVSALTAKNTSSMRQDMINARKTEAEEILGYVVTQAKQLSLKTPRLKALYDQINQRQSTRPQPQH